MCTKWEVDIFNMWTIIMQSLNKKEWKLLELQITQTRHPKSVADRRTDGQTDGRSGPTTRPAFAKATQVKNMFLCSQTKCWLWGLKFTKVHVRMANREDPVSGCFFKESWLSWLEFTKVLVRIATGKTLVRLLLQKQSDLGLHCLSRTLC